MKFTIVALVSSFAVLATAQTLGDLPKCAQDCVGNSLGSTGCTNLDFACICKSSGWIAGLSCCISKACSPADQAATIKFASQLCAIDGVTLPQSASCAAGASATASATTASATGAVTSSTVTATVTGSTTTGTVTAVVVSTSGTASRSASTASTASTAPTASTASPSGSSTGTASAAGTSSSSAAAPHIVGAGMGVFGAAIAALAFL